MPRPNTPFSWAELNALDDLEFNRQVQEYMDQFAQSTGYGLELLQDEDDDAHQEDKSMGDEYLDNAPTQEIVFEPEDDSSRNRTPTPTLPANPALHRSNAAGPSFFYQPYILATRDYDLGYDSNATTPSSKQKK